VIYALLDQLDWLQETPLRAVVMVFDRTSFRALAALSLSFAFVLAFGKPVVRRLAALKIGDIPRTDVAALDEALASKKNTPTMGGVLIAGAILVSTLLLADVRSFYVQMALIVTVWMAGVGGADDWLKLTSANRPGGGRQGLYSWEKLVFQLGLGVMIGWFVYRHGDTDAAADLAHALNLPLQKTYVNDPFGPNPGLFYLGPVSFMIVSTLLIAGMSNAVNITDGMDGLASGISAWVALGLMALSFISGWQVAAQYLLVPYVPGADELAIVAGAMCGACLGFLWWNAWPAIVFMGDTGSLCLGGLIGYLAIVIRQEVLVLLMCGVFLLEIGSVVLQVGYFKATRGQRIFRCAPYHWHLHMGGWAEQKIVARLWIVTVILVALALASIKVR
jgi:phospho-N-acetylmuramoyl-pentapeptide-transferase